MISPVVRSVSYHKRSLSGIALRFHGSLSHPPIRSNPLIYHRSQILKPAKFFQKATMSSSNNSSRNDPFTRDKLFDLKGHVALVTGGGSGIGLMATQALVANGAKVYITGRTKSKLDHVVELYSHGNDTIVPVACDVTSKTQIADLVNQVKSQEGYLSILVNNAGISSSTLQTEARSAQEMRENLFDAESSSVDDWTDAYRTNVPPIFFATAAFLPLLQKSSERFPGWSGTVVNISSISGLVKTSQHHFAYNASKAAAVHLTRMLAAETAANGLKIRVNSIAPGVFPSEMTTEGSGDDQKSYIEREKYQKIPAGRPGKDDDMAQTILFFAANQYLNGQTVAVDGGYTLAAGQ
ncbi:uncharacterized protein GGS22DRAFT_199588 [Annulohypoxylon maeteangense]|uniref:uncharacterized protein n=1 Tax=Annulohypoxylon maeteangense TaxID=1927788 RepID=UPI002008C7DF|nr:uncharacterized protein GGS22DRAFT_199588 [Annulohypoxylon maeteangense]KAI0886303.1 hypothetical protein GGS22DRAFT_199588 [Annulohypoxylon maeteangense]